MRKTLLISLMSVLVFLAGCRHQITLSVSKDGTTNPVVKKGDTIEFFAPASDYTFIHFYGGYSPCGDYYASHDLPLKNGKGSCKVTDSSGLADTFKFNFVKDGKILMAANPCKSCPGSTNAPPGNNAQVADSVTISNTNDGSNEVYPCGSGQDANPTLHPGDTFDWSYTGNPVLKSEIDWAKATGNPCDSGGDPVSCTIKKDILGTQASSQYSYKANLTIKTPNGSATKSCSGQITVSSTP